MSESKTRKKFFIRFDSAFDGSPSNYDAVSIREDEFENFHNQTVKVFNNRNRQLAEFWT